MRLATEVQTKLHTLVTLTRAGIVHPERPDHLWHTARALLRFGTTPAAGYSAAARNHPNEPAVIDELGTLELQGGRGAHQRDRARAARPTGSARATASRSCAATTAAGSTPCSRARSSARTPCS